MNETAAVAGFTLKLAGVNYAIRPLTAFGIRKIAHLLPLIERGRTIDPAFIDACVEIVRAALRQDYPHLTSRQVAYMIGMGDLSAILAAATGGGITLVDA